MTVALCSRSRFERAHVRDQRFLEALRLNLNAVIAGRNQLESVDATVAGGLCAGSVSLGADVGHNRAGDRTALRIDTVPRTEERPVCANALPQKRKGNSSAPKSEMVSSRIRFSNLHNCRSNANLHRLVFRVWNAVS